MLNLFYIDIIDIIDIKFIYGCFLMNKNKTQEYDGLNKKYIIRLLDILGSVFAIILLFPLLIILTIAGAFTMKGNPFFIQLRTGKNKKTV